MLSTARMNNEHKKKIIRLIELMPVTGDKVTWKNIEKFSGFTRATLNKYEDIVEAYESAKNKKRHVKSTDEKIADLDEKVAKLETENARLKASLELLKNKYVRWLYNASNEGVSEEVLNREIPYTMKLTKRKKGLR